MHITDVDPAAHSSDPTSAQAFGHLLTAAFVFLLAISTTFMPKTYIPDRWMIGGWIVLTTGLGVALTSYFLGVLGWVRARFVAQILAALLFVLGMACTVVFVSEGDDGSGGDDTNYAAR